MYNEKQIAEKVGSFSLFALVPLMAFATVLVLPFLLGFLATATDWDGTRSILLFDFSWVGLQNYSEVIRDSEFWSVLGFTFKYVLFVVLFTNIIAFGIAVLVTSPLFGRNFFRSVFFVPNLIGGVILGFIWVFVFSRFAVYIGEVTGLKILEFSWLVEPEKAFWAMVMLSVWQMSGYMMLIYVAGLVTVPKDVIEAAQIDGAGYFRRLRAVVVPLMIPSFTISLFLTLRNSFMTFDANLALTGGGPFRSTELVTLHIYNEAFLFQNYGSGQAKALMLFFVVAIVAGAQVLISKRLEDRT